MATSTPNLQLRKPDDSDDVNVKTDLGDNYDIIDNAIGNQLSGPSCILTRSATFSIPNDSYTMVTWTDSEVNDAVSGNTMWSGSGSGRINIRKSGIYIPFAKLNWSANTSSGQRIALITVNGTDAGGANNGTVGFNNRDGGPLSSRGVPLNVPGVGAYLNAGDVIRCVAYQNSGASLDLSASGDGGKMRFGLLWQPPYLGS